MGKGGEDSVNKQAKASGSLKLDTFHAWAKDTLENARRRSVLAVTKG